MTNSRVERKLINGQLCDVYHDENGKVDLIHWVGVGRSKWGNRNCPAPKNAFLADSVHKNVHDKLRMP